MRYIKKIQGKVMYGCGTMSVVISFTIMDFCLPYIMPLVRVSESVMPCFPLLPLLLGFVFSVGYMPLVKKQFL
jgi:hypothetical protein